MINRTKSFQNCTEADVPGYNDCPLFLLQGNKKSTTKRTRIIPNAVDICGNIKAATVPPPPMKRVVSSNTPVNETILMTPSADTSSSSTASSKEQLMDSVRELLSKETRLPPQEFKFYKNKVISNIETSLNTEQTRSVMSQVFDALEDKDKVKALLIDWIATDTTVGSWCPAFRKIVENIVI